MLKTLHLSRIQRLVFSVIEAYDRSRHPLTTRASSQWYKCRGTKASKITSLRQLKSDLLDVEARRTIKTTPLQLRWRPILNSCDRCVRYWIE